MRDYAGELRAISPAASLVLAANKSDLADGRQLTPAQVESAAVDLAAPHYLTSARTGEGVEGLFRHLARLLVA